MLRQACASHLLKVRQTFAGAPVLELCFDGSQVSIRNHDIFAVYAPTASGGASENSEGAAAYLPPVQTQELGWRVGDPGEQLTPEDVASWEIAGWKSRKGVRAAQAARSLQHVLVNMLESRLPDFAPPNGLERMSSGDERTWDEEEARWYRGPPPPSGSSHRTSMEPELPNIGEVPRFLLLTMDQKQTQWNMAHFMVSFYMCFFRGDLYHRSWNLFKWALRCAKGWQHHSMMQLCHALRAVFRVEGHRVRGCRAQH